MRMRNDGCSLARALLFFLGLNSVVVGSALGADTVQNGLIHTNAKTPDKATTDANIQANQKTLATNQGNLMDNQGVLVRNQSAINNNVKTWLSNAITEDQMQSLLLDENISEKGFDNLVDQLKFVFSHSSEIQASAYQDQAVSLFQSAAQSSTVAQAKAGLMSNYASLILSGAGNDNASETLWVSDFLDGVSDPSNVTITTFNSIIYPYVKTSANGLSYELSTCSSSVEKDTGAPEAVCNLMKSVLYAQALSDSCSGSYSAASSSSSQASSSTSTQSQAASASQSSSTGPSYDPTIYPSGFTGGCSGLYYQTENENWNGWNPTLNALLAVNSMCQSFSSSSVPSRYQGMTDPIVTACSDVASVVKNYDPKTGQDASDYAQDLMADFKTPLSDLVKYSRRLLVKSIFDTAMQSSVKQNPNMAYYGSLYTLLGPDTYFTKAQDSASGAQSTTSAGVTSTPIDLTPPISNDCIDLIKSGSYTLTVDTSTDGTDQSKLASLLIQQIASMYPMRTVLPIVNIPKPSGAVVAVIINGQVVALDSDGKVMTVDQSTSSSVPQIEQDVTSISSAQSSVVSSMVTANQLFQGQMDSFLKGKTAAISPLVDAYADRFLQITVKGSSTTCQLTPAQLNKYAATWRLNPNVQFKDAGSTDTSVVASWGDHLATSSSSEVSKEIAVLEAQSNYMKYLQYHQNEKLGLAGTLVPLMQSAAQTANMKVQSAMLDKLVGDYVKGVKPNSSTSPSGTSG